eukprot:m.90336 g.90336  ORF g.90336 m.90336 type:complete len:966 (-) comp13262_c0_seq2:49-2946(-)
MSGTRPSSNSAESELHLLRVGEDVSAKYRGAWCEGTIRKVERNVTAKVLFSSGGSTSCKASDIRGTLQVGASVQALKADEDYEEATIQKLTDCSLYTVRFHDGDERRLRRNHVTPMGPSHFEDGNTLGDFPLTDPDIQGGTSPGSTVSKLKSPESQGRKRRRISTENVSPVARRTLRDAPRPQGKYHELVLVNPTPDNEVQNEFWWPALVVPHSEVTREMIGAKEYNPSLASVVRFFEDKLFAVIEHEYMRLMTHNTNPLERFKADPSFCKHPGVNEALEFLKTKALPQGFKWKLWDGKCDEEALKISGVEAIEDGVDPNWNPDHIVEQTFTAALLEWMTNAGTPIKRTPSVGFKDLDLFKLFFLVNKEGGFQKVGEKSLWKNIYASITNLEEGEEPPPSAEKTIKGSYEKYLLSFDESQHSKVFKSYSSNLDPSAIYKMANEAPVSNAAEGELQVGRTSSSPRLTPGTVKDSEGYLFRVGDYAKCKYTDGKHYVVKIEDRELRPQEGNSKAKAPWYYIHYKKWHRKFDTWVPDSQLSVDKSSENAPKRRRADPNRPVAKAVIKHEARTSAKPSPQETQDSPSKPEPKNPKSGPNSAKKTRGNKRSKTQTGKMTDEELAQMLAHHELARAGRRRETRRSWQTSRIVIGTSSKSISPDMLELGKNEESDTREDTPEIQKVESDQEDPKEEKEEKEEKQVKPNGEAESHKRQEKDQISPTKRGKRRRRGGSKLSRQKKRKMPPSPIKTCYSSKCKPSTKSTCYSPACRFRKFGSQKKKEDIPQEETEERNEHQGGVQAVQPAETKSDKEEEKPSPVQDTNEKKDDELPESSDTKEEENVTQEDVKQEEETEDDRKKPTNGDSNVEKQSEDDAELAAKGDTEPKEQEAASEDVVKKQEVEKQAAEVARKREEDAKRQEEQGKQLMETLNSWREKPILEQIDLIKERYEDHMRAVKVLTQLQRKKNSRH